MSNCDINIINSDDHISRAGEQPIKSNDPNSVAARDGSGMFLNLDICNREQSIIRLAKHKCQNG